MWGKCQGGKGGAFPGSCITLRIHSTWAPFPGCHWYCPSRSVIMDELHKGAIQHSLSGARRAPHAPGAPEQLGGSSSVHPRGKSGQRPPPPPATSPEPPATRRALRAGDVGVSASRTVPGSAAGPGVSRFAPSGGDGRGKPKLGAPASSKREPRVGEVSPREGPGRPRPRAGGG